MAAMVPILLFDFLRQLLGKGPESISTTSKNQLKNKYSPCPKAKGINTIFTIPSRIVLAPCNIGYIPAALG
ncbi:MAG TPA: hypothetical protein DHV55_03260 [Clostridiaceae bacterium]|nr:hypothetical protein [Clostridiaceae bacterium]